MFLCFFFSQRHGLLCSLWSVFVAFCTLKLQWSDVFDGAVSVDDYFTVILFGSFYHFIWEEMDCIFPTSCILGIH